MGAGPAKEKYISRETFEKRYLTREDKYKYEWVDGVVEKTERIMNQYHDLLSDNLIYLFYQLKFGNKISGRLTKEVDTFFLPKIHRRPDLCWFSGEQSVKIAEGKEQVPEFVVEIISKNDRIRKVKEKMKNYEDAGVKCVWLIYPDLEEVEVCHGVKTVTYRGTETISAAPVLPVFEMTVADVFKKPTAPE